VERGSRRRGANGCAAAAIPTRAERSPAEVRREAASDCREGAGGNSGFVGKTGDGDLYAGKEREVYRKTDDGWQHYQDGEWNSRTARSPRIRRPRLIGRSPRRSRRRRGSSWTATALPLARYENMQRSGAEAAAVARTR